MEALSSQERKDELFGAACDGNVRLLKKMARALNSGGQDEAAFLAAMVDDDGDTLLQMAATHGRLDVLRYLVEDLRLDVNQPNSIGDTPLCYSAFAGKADATKYLLAHGADPLVGKNFLPLHGAACQGHCDVVELLLSRGIDVDLGSARGTPLQVAAMKKQHGTMKILLEHHANPNNAKVSLTPLRWVIHDPVPSKSLRCMKLLIKAGADVNFVDSNGFTTVIYAAKLGSPALMKCLLDAGANPNIPDEFGRMPIEYAAYYSKRDMVEVLFPSTSPISTLPEWSIDGIIYHVKSFGLKPMDKQKCEMRIRELKQQASEAFKREEYIIAGHLYTCAMEFECSPDDYATLLANRSLCMLRMGENKRAALSDATQCRMVRPFWPKACYRQGAAYMALKEYEKACDSFADGLKLQPTNTDIANALREAREALKNARCSEK
ncbi:ankyrin-3-like [Lolium rigidum]|uniref:ankyrin-3-like n=1 Tax=Lolium rigidum TaxID=89674 RepID=UPI001F5D0337|nr:ankyrin-3-like [Lolium rigidum]